MQPDLFGDVPQPTPPPPPPRARPLTSADVRDQMLALIEAARAADRFPWEEHEGKRHIAMFPIMAMWLAPEDGAELSRRFDYEIARLRAAD